MSDIPVNNVILDTVTVRGQKYDIIHMQDPKDFKLAVGVLVKAWPKWEIEILRNHGLSNKRDDSAEPNTRVVVAVRNAQGQIVGAFTGAINHESGTAFLQYLTIAKQVQELGIGTALAGLALKCMVDVANQKEIPVKAAFAELTPGRPDEQALKALLTTPCGEVFYPKDQSVETNLPKAGRNAWEQVVRDGIESNEVWYVPVNNATQAEAAKAVAHALDKLSWTKWYTALDFAGRLKHAAIKKDRKEGGPTSSQVGKFINRQKIGDSNEPWDGQLASWRKAAKSLPTVLKIIEDALALPLSPIVAFLDAHHRRNQLVLRGIATGNTDVNNEIPAIDPVVLRDGTRFPPLPHTGGKPNAPKPKGGGTPPTPPGD